jgi:hypothetical protein
VIKLKILYYKIIETPPTLPGQAGNARLTKALEEKCYE